MSEGRHAHRSCIALICGCVHHPNIGAEEGTQRLFRKEGKGTFSSEVLQTPQQNNMAAAAAAPSGGGVHFVVPDGTVLITQPPLGSGEGHDSWREWGVDKEMVTSVTIPTSVTRIGRNAFVKFSSLTAVAIPTSVTSLGSGAFQGCRSLTSVDITPSVTRIERWTFARCSSLTSVGIPASVIQIDYGAFIECCSLISVNIPT